MPAKSVIELLPLYQQVRLELENFLADWPVKTQIPTEKEIVERFKVSRVTARKALQAMRRDGTLESFPGRGTFLARSVTARTSAARSANLIGLLVPNASDPMVGGVVRGVEAEASRHGCHVLLSHDHNNPELQITQLGKMLEARAKGILLYPDRFVTERREFLDLLEEFRRRAVPLVFLDRYVPNTGFPCVMTDNVSGMYQVTEHVICCGRRRPALIGFWPSNTVHQDRRRGFVEALRDHGLPPRPALEAEISGDRDFFQAARETVTSWVRGKKREALPFDSIVCMFDMLAFGAFTALREAGFSVPGDVALSGYDNFDSEVYRTLGLELTSVQQPRDETGATAVGLLLKQIGRRAPAAGRMRNVLLPPKLVVRTSCGEKAAGR
ncbi:MAG: GntR family transcriptional regulator [Opitutaceae bacterium]|jgi:DNA-binding LacI/PurR family transcriptional regulator|nr:GntR family transcriptional regulator [Opitutaceae bacterium]